MIRNKVVWDKHYYSNRFTVRNIFLLCYSRFRLICIFKNANLRFVKKFENTGSIEDERRTNQRLKYARTSGVITKVKDMFAETPQITVCKLANSITENASSTSV